MSAEVVLRGRVMARDMATVGARVRAWAGARVRVRVSVRVRSSGWCPAHLV